MLRNSIINQIKSVINVSKVSRNERMIFASIELIPLLLYYGSIYFGLINIYTFKHSGSFWVFDFLLIVICIDSIGDSFIFKGIQEFALAIRSRNIWNYSILPGQNILKIILFRFDFPTVMLGILSGIILNFRIYHSSGSLIYLILFDFSLLLGIVTHMTLTSFYFLIQGYFDPKMSILFGNPVTKIYTKPIALLWNGGFALVFLKVFYPVFFATAFPHDLLTRLNLTPIVFLKFFAAQFFMGCFSICIWLRFGNFLVLKIIEKWGH